MTVTSVVASTEIKPHLKQKAAHDAIARFVHMEHRYMQIAHIFWYVVDMCFVSLFCLSTCCSHHFTSFLVGWWSQVTQRCREFSFLFLYRSTLFFLNINRRNTIAKASFLLVVMFVACQTTASPNFHESTSEQQYQ